MRKLMEVKSFIGVRVIIFKEKQVLLEKRKIGQGANTWTFPGGHLEFMEKLEDCAYREILEESGIKIMNLRQIKTVETLLPDAQKHGVTIWYEADYESGDAEVKEPDEALAFEWFDWDKLPRPLFVITEDFLKTGYTPTE